MLYPCYKVHVWLKCYLNWTLDTEDASETDMAKLEEEFTEMKEQ